MKYLFRVTIFLFAFLMLNQANSQGINFQGVARSANGTIIASSNISLRLSIISKNVDATPEYVETKTVVTNQQGIFSVVVGDAVNATIIGSFKNIAWVDGIKFLKVEMDPAAGTNFINMGATQLQYVPYSFYSLGVAAANINGVLPIEKGGTGITSPGSKGNILYSNGTKWESKPFIIRDSIFANFKVDSTNMRFQPSSLSKLDKKSGSSFVSDSAEINDGNYAWYNIAIGDSALYIVDSGSNNIAIGFKSLIKNTSGRSNTSIGGNNNLNANTRGYQNNAVGSATMNANTTGNRNNSYGTLSMNANTTGFANSAYGNASLMSNVTGNENSSFGRMSTLSLKAGSYNSVFGNQAMVGDTLGNFNTALGYNAGSGLRNGNNNIFIGSNAGNNSTFSSANNRLVIAVSNTNTPLIYGEFDNSKLTVNGTLTANSFKVPGGTSAQYLRADGTVATSVTSGVPYSGASQAVNLGAYDLMVNGITVGVGAGTSTSSTNTAIGNGVLGSNTTGYNNVGVGYIALRSNTIGAENIAIGRAALNSNTTGGQNIALGTNSISLNTTGGRNIGIGLQALQKNTSGNSNVAISTGALNENTTGFSNIAIGDNAMQNNTIGDRNIAIGTGTLINNTIGKYNIAIGSDAMQSNIQGDRNTAIGLKSLRLSTGNSNTSIGFYSLEFATSGQYNTSVGDQSLTQVTTGNYNTSIGYNAGGKLTQGSNNIYIGANAQESNFSASNETVIGNTSTESADIKGVLKSHGQIVSFKTKASAYTLLTSDEVVVADAANGTFTITLPTASGVTGQTYTIKRINTGNNVTIATTSSQTIDGASSHVLNTQFAFIKVVSDGNNWVIIGKN